MVRRIEARRDIGGCSFVRWYDCPMIPACFKTFKAIQAVAMGIEKSGKHLTAIGVLWESCWRIYTSTRASAKQFDNRCSPRGISPLSEACAPDTRRTASSHTFRHSSIQPQVLPLSGLKISRSKHYQVATQNTGGESTGLAAASLTK